LIVVDASILVTALADDGTDGDLARLRLRGERLTAPCLIDVEVAAAWRRLASLGQLDDRRVRLAMRDLLDLRLERVLHGPLLERCWELRGNLTIYDAAYVALAELLEVRLLTADGRIRSAPGPRCPIEVLAPAAT
jgi:predicted nucleic acid-binding protein